MGSGLIWDEVRPGTEHTPLLCADLPGISGELTAAPEDFHVDEILPYEPNGEGSHFFVQVRKTRISTADAARRLADAAGVSVREVGFAGQKDFHSVSTQWFSLPIKPQQPSCPGLEILEICPHPKKLKNGHVKANRFRVKIRQVHPEAELRLSGLLARLGNGYPNYFGCQRFGKNGRNLTDVLRWIHNGCPRLKNARFLVSALQSAVFNAWLGQRLQREGLEKAIVGDLLRKRDTGGLFRCDDVDTETNRLVSGALDLCGPLFGPKMKNTSHEAYEREQAFVKRLNLSADAARSIGRLGAGGRRPARVLATQFEYTKDGPHLDLAFTLPSGAYATVFLAELMQPEKGWVERRRVTE